ncbi:ATP-binding cassette domain-containing protein [Glaciihabitans sp. UYNi722]|uniref:ATP-binding cassette domain-containing protein n=1 Tax=Glaciihabitans sp. UYNi722 TaxID=3156344 RepID=UPI003398848C
MALSVRDCCFAYRRRPPLFSNLDVVFEAGRTVLLGPNGAGKSTLLALCGGVMKPGGGTIALNEESRTTSPKYRARVAWLPQTVSVFPGLTVREQVVYYGWLKGMPVAAAKIRADDALELVRLTSSSSKKARELSGGQLRRLGIAGALVQNADAILLDEPFAGLDPTQRDSLSNILLALPGETILVVSTHQIEDLSSLYTRTVVLDSGTVRFDGTTDKFLQSGHGAVDPARVAYASFVGAEE